MMKKLEIMDEIQNQKQADITANGQQELNAEGQAMTQEKKETLDFPANAVKIDPLR